MPLLLTPGVVLDRGMLEQIPYPSILSSFRTLILISPSSPFHERGAIVQAEYFLQDIVHVPETAAANVLAVLEFITARYFTDTHSNEEA